MIYRVPAYYTSSTVLEEYVYTGTQVPTTQVQLYQYMYDLPVPMTDVQLYPLSRPLPLPTPYLLPYRDALVQLYDAVRMLWYLINCAVLMMCCSFWCSFL